MSYAFINMDGNYMLELDEEILIEANAVAKLERERIIKLLEESQKSQPCQCDDCGDHVWDKAIALIKGNNK